MKDSSLIRYALALVVVGVVLIDPRVSLAQGCSQRAVTTSAADVYERPPQYTTGIGWQGARVATLPARTQVYICEQRNVEFGFSSKSWFRIAYMAPEKQWRYGWVLDDHLEKWRSKLGEGSERAWASMAVAEAQIATKEGEQWSLPVAPTPQGDTSPSLSAIRTADWHDLGVLYAPLFVAMLLGMLAKTVVDYVDASDSKDALRQHTRNALVAVLVSPIVFLGFLTAGQFSTSTQTFIVLWLLAFQNGFFWQTVLKRESAPRSESDGRPSERPVPE